MGSAEFYRSSENDPRSGRIRFHLGRSPARIASMTRSRIPPSSRAVCLPLALRRSSGTIPNRAIRAAHARVSPRLDVSRSRHHKDDEQVAAPDVQKLHCYFSLALSVARGCAWAFCSRISSHTATMSFPFLLVGSNARVSSRVSYPTVVASRSYVSWNRIAKSKAEQAAASDGHKPSRFSPQSGQYLKSQRAISSEHLGQDLVVIRFLSCARVWAVGVMPSNCHGCLVP